MRASFAVVMAVCGCVGTETGNPITSEGTTSDSMTAALVTTPGVPFVEQAWISVSSVRAILGESCDHLSSRHGDGAVGNVLERLELEAPVEPVTCGVHLALAPGSSVDAPAAFEGSVGLVTGRRADGTPFELRTTTTEGIDVRGALGIDLEMESFVLSFDVARWIGAVDLTVAPDPDGVVRISDVTFDTAWTRSAELYVDTDADGRLSVDERARGPVATSHR